MWPYNCFCDNLVLTCFMRLLSHLHEALFLPIPISALERTLVAFRYLLLLLYVQSQCPHSLIFVVLLIHKTSTINPDQILWIHYYSFLVDLFLNR